MIIAALIFLYMAIHTRIAKYASGNQFNGDMFNTANV